MTADPFIAHRGLFFTVAYEMLGSATDAEDVVQDTWLRWDAIGEDARAAVRDPRAFLVRMVTRKALDRLRANAWLREEYVGEWLPEPLLTAPDVADDVELAESVSIAMLTVLETLTPTERAVFVLREVFDTPYAEIAQVVGKSAAAVRQIGHRAREHVAARRPRMEVSRGEQQEVVERFLKAVTQGDLQGLLDVLAPDVVLVADGGGVVQAVVNPVMGAKKVANLLRPFNRLAPRPRSCRCCSTARSAPGSWARTTATTLRSASSWKSVGSAASTPSATPPSSDGSTSRRRSAASVPGMDRWCVAYLRSCRWTNGHPVADPLGREPRLMCVFPPLAHNAAGGVCARSCRQTSRWIVRRRAQARARCRPTTVGRFWWP